MFTVADTAAPTEVHRALAALRDGAARLAAKPDRGLFSPARLVAEVGTTAWTFQRHAATGTWRMTFVSTYGNGSFVRGAGCDASGWVAPAHIAAGLTELHAELTD